MGRIYDGRWQVLVTLDKEGEDIFDLTEPATYEICEAICLLFGWGAPFKEQMVKAAIVVKAPVNSPID